uniref:Uncharacterized protein n=1 Tax=Amphimedon queenslandica TaxID=400682 RepID=A0A1X7TYN3_AMPQE
MKSVSEEDCDALFEAAFRIKISSKKLKTLEKECAALTDRLIQGQVTRAQEYEEVYGVRRELTTLRKKVPSFEKKEESQNNHVHNILETECTSALSLKDTPQQPPPHYWFQLKKEIKNRTHRNCMAIVKIECAECADLLKRKICLKCGSNAVSINGVASSSVNCESSKQAVTIDTIEDHKLQFNKISSNFNNVIQTPLEYNSRGSLSTYQYMKPFTSIATSPGAPVNQYSATIACPMTAALSCAAGRTSHINETISEGSNSGLIAGGNATAMAMQGSSKT